MNTIVPVTIVLSLGAGSGLILRHWLASRWTTSLLAGIAATALWGIGVEVLLALTAPHERGGKTHYEGILIVFLTAFIASRVALQLLGDSRSNATVPPNQPEAT